MAKRHSSERDGLVHFDPRKLERQQLRKGLSTTKLAERADVARNTVLKALRGAGIFPNSALAIANALGFDDPNDLLPSGDGKEPVAEEGQALVGGQWRAVEYLGPWITASNGLQFRVCRMQHEFVETRQGRGKWYDLLHLSSRDRESRRAHLLRHCLVCERIGPHRHLSDNLSSSPGGDQESWWVVDRWIKGRTLAERIKSDPYPREQLARLMCEIALGLESLHAAKVVFRELAPSRVIIAQDGGRAILTDFELAKLLDTMPTVSADWPDDPYRAPEVENGEASERSDLYSWARILLRAASGKELPTKGQDSDALTRVGLPKAVWRVVTDCLSPAPSDRPKSAEQVLQAIETWGSP
jgi:serine/threonine protein kinase